MQARRFRFEQRLQKAGKDVKYTERRKTYLELLRNNFFVAGTSGTVIHLTSSLILMMLFDIFSFGRCKCTRTLSDMNIINNQEVHYFQHHTWSGKLIGQLLVLFVFEGWRLCNWSQKKTVSLQDDCLLGIYFEHVERTWNRKQNCHRVKKYELTVECILLHVHLQVLIFISVPTLLQKVPVISFYIIQCILHKD